MAAIVDGVVKYYGGGGKLTQVEHELSTQHHEELHCTEGTQSRHNTAEEWVTDLREAEWHLRSRRHTVREGTEDDTDDDEEPEEESQTVEDTRKRRGDCDRIPATRKRNDDNEPRDNPEDHGSKRAKTEREEEASTEVRSEPYAMPPKPEPQGPNLSTGEQEEGGHKDGGRRVRGRGSGGRGPANSGGSGHHAEQGPQRGEAGQSKSGASKRKDDARRVGGDRRQQPQQGTTQAAAQGQKRGTRSGSTGSIHERNGPPRRTGGHEGEEIEVIVQAETNDAVESVLYATETRSAHERDQSRSHGPIRHRTTERERRREAGYKTAKHRSGGEGGRERRTPTAEGLLCREPREIGDGNQPPREETPGGAARNGARKRARGTVTEELRNMDNCAKMGDKGKMQPLREASATPTSPPTAGRTVTRAQRRIQQLHGHEQSTASAGERAAHGSQTVNEVSQDTRSGDHGRRLEETRPKTRGEDGTKSKEERRRRERRKFDMIRNTEVSVDCEDARVWKRYARTQPLRDCGSLTPKYNIFNNKTRGGVDSGDAHDTHD